MKFFTEIKSLFLILACTLLMACGSGGDESAPLPDADNDTIPDARDNCIQVANPDQLNADGDSAGDACDTFPEDPTEISDNDNDGEGDNKDTDDDNDGTPDVDDAFPFDRTEQADIDEDGIGDNKDLDLTDTTGKNPKSIQMSRLLETGRATEIHNLDGYKFKGVITSIGDVNHDGIDDLAIADSRYTTVPGYVYVLFGPSSGWPASLDLNNLQSITDSGVDYIEIQAIENYLPEEGLDNIGLGSEIAALGDVSGDGIDDFSITKHYDGKDKDESLEYKNNYPGEVMIVFGREAENWTDNTLTVDELKAQYAYSLYTEGFIHGFGESVLNAGDINGDGTNELVITEMRWEDSEQAERESKVHILFNADKMAVGRDNINDLPLLSTVGEGYEGISRVEIFGDEDYNYFNDLTLIDDFNNDGYPDFALNANSDSGSVFVFFGKDSWADSLDISSMSAEDGFKITDLGSRPYTKRPIASGDINGDGISDLVVSAPDWAPYDPVFNPFLDPLGRTIILWGGRGNWPAEIKQRELTDFYGTRIHDIDGEGVMGEDVAVIPDTNGDGTDELFISKAYSNGNADDDLEAPYHNPKGNVFKIMGRENWSLDVSIADVTDEWIQGIHLDKPLGGQLDVSADFNGDGILDWIFVDEFTSGPTPEGYTSSSYVIYGYHQLYPEVE